MLGVCVRELSERALSPSACGSGGAYQCCVTVCVSSTVGALVRQGNWVKGHSAEEQA